MAQVQATLLAEAFRLPVPAAETENLAAAWCDSFGLLEQKCLPEPMVQVAAGAASRPPGSEENAFMSSTHRKKIARALAEETGITYQQSLTRVVEADESGLLPHTLNAAGIARAVEALSGEEAVDAPPVPSERRTVTGENEASTPTPFNRDDMFQVRLGLRRVAGLTRHGVNPSSAFETVAESMTGDPKAVFVDISGSANSLAAAMGAHPMVFEPWAVAMVAAGEQAGNLGAALDELAALISLS